MTLPLIMLDIKNAKPQVWSLIDSDKCMIMSVSHWSFIATMVITQRKITNTSPSMMCHHYCVFNTIFPWVYKIFIIAFHWLALRLSLMCTVLLTPLLGVFWPDSHTYSKHVHTHSWTLTMFPLVNHRP